jgi:hypothetical protein
MLAQPPALTYESTSPSYVNTYHMFLRCTDQKTRAREKLGEVIAMLENRRVFIDVGAADGAFTEWFTDQFERTAAIEPNPLFAALFSERLPGVDLYETSIDEVQLDAAADLVLCAHVMFHIPRYRWLMTAEKMLGWLAPSGALVMFLQSPSTDCMEMLRYFGVEPPNLRELKDEISLHFDGAYETSICELPAHVETRGRNWAHRVAEFMLNCLPPVPSPTRRVFHNYVEDHFRRASGVYRFSCDQDCLIVQRRGRSRQT